MDGVVVTWEFGYRYAVMPCHDDEICVDATSPGFDPSASCDAVAFCSPLAEPDPLGEEVVFTTCEDDRTIVFCLCRYRWEAGVCEDPGPRCTFVEVEGTQDQGACR